MKRFFISIMFLFVLTLASSLALAHPPEAVHGFYDLDRQELGVTVQHLVSKPKQHYVEEVRVYKGGQEVAHKRFDFQTSHRNQTMPPFKIPASVGDSFRVVAKCVVSGDYEATIEVTEAKPDVRELN